MNPALSCTHSEKNIPYTLELAAYVRVQDTNQEDIPGNSFELPEPILS